eukprot:3242311-Pyramimonas_sp.AAC.1
MACYSPRPAGCRAMPPPHIIHFPFPLAWRLCLARRVHECCVALHAVSTTTSAMKRGNQRPRRG